MCCRWSVSPCSVWAGAFLLGASKSPFSLIFTLGGFIALLLLAQAVASRPDVIDGIGVRVLTWFNSLRGKPSHTGVDAWLEAHGNLSRCGAWPRSPGTPAKVLSRPRAFLVFSAYHFAKAVIGLDRGTPSGRFQFAGIDDQLSA